MKVKLIAYTPEPERIVAAAAKTCYSSRSVDKLLEDTDGEKAADFLEMLDSYGHESPIEHVSFTFAVEGVSRSLLAQLTRHRIASYSVRSQRYVSQKNFSYVTPPEIENIPEAKKIFDDIMKREGAAYNKLTELLAGKHEASGMDARGALKKAQEDARYVLPNAANTQLVVTMNARSLRNMFRQRCCNRAQWEIRALANEMLRLVKEVSPSLFAHAGPPCVTGPCPEGKMSCGRAAEMRERYGNNG